MSWPLSRQLRLGLVAVTIGLAAALALAEGLARAIWPELAFEDRVSLRSWQQEGLQKLLDCYPSQGPVAFPINLQVPEHVTALIKVFPRFRVVENPVAQARPERRQWVWGSNTVDAIDAIRSRTPYCVLYEDDVTSERVLAVPSRFERTFALLGDSFVYGQGVAAAEALPAALARRTRSRVRSYAFLGDDLPRVEAQFREMLRERAALKFSHVLYVLVLNDFPRPDAHRARLNMIDDLMNLRRSFWSEHPNRVLAAAMPVVLRSRFLHVLHDRFLLWGIRRQTLAWYRELLDPEKNPLLVPAFERIKDMRLAAESAGLAFTVVIHPLILDLENYPLEVEHARLRQLAQEHGIATLDLLPVFQQNANRQDFRVHAVDRHPNARAHALTAEAIARYLETRPD